MLTIRRVLVLALAITAMLILRLILSICRFARSREVGDAPGNKLGMMSWSVIGNCREIHGRIYLFIDNYLFMITDDMCMRFLVEPQESDRCQNELIIGRVSDVKSQLMFFLPCTGYGGTFIRLFIIARSYFSYF